MEYRIYPAFRTTGRIVLMNNADLCEAKEAVQNIELRDNPNLDSFDLDCPRHVRWEEFVNCDSLDDFVSFLNSIGCKENPNLEIH